MRVAFVVYGGLDPRSGGYLYDNRLADALRAAGDEVDVVALPERPYLRSLADNLDGGVVDRLRSGGYDLVVEDELCHPSLPLVNRRLPADLPVASVVHHLRSAEPRAGWRNRGVRALERAYLRGVDALVCNSEATRRSVRELGVEAPATVAPPGGDRLGPDVDAARVEARAREGPLRVVAVGSLEPRKGQDTLVEGLARVPGDWELTLVGGERDAGFAADVRALAAAEGVADRVTFAGRVDDDRLAAELADAHAFALPSRYEGFGIAYLEAMGFGLPAVASTAGGASEFVADRHNGALVDPDDPLAVADALAPLVGDRDRLARLGRRALATYEAHPTWAESCAAAREFLAAVADGVAR